MVKDGQERTIAADVVVNAGGMFAPEIGRLAGVDVPIVPMAHEYLFTERIDGVSPTLPTMRDPDNLVYFREEVGGLCMGGYERHPAPWSLDGIPADFNGKLLAPDWPRFAEIMDGAVRRVPAIGDAGINRLINGPEAFTPDNEFILGESEVRGFFVAAGFCAHGIAGAGGIGRQVASWIVDGEPELDLWKMDIRRFGAQYRSQGVHPGPERSRSTRPTTTSTTPTRSAAPAGRCACRRPTDGWSSWVRPSARSPAGSGRTGSSRTRRPATTSLRPRGWAGQHWSPAIGAEALATRTAAGLFDESSFSKIEIAGPGACAFLQRLCANDIDRPVGSIVYTQMLNRRGGIEADFTVTRLAADRFLIVTGTAFGNHDLGWIRKHLDEHGPTKARSSSRIGPAARPASGCGARGRATSSRPAPGTTCPTPGSRT